MHFVYYLIKIFGKKRKNIIVIMTLMILRLFVYIIKLDIDNLDVYILYIY